MSKREHISYSELKDWATCTHYHKKAWVERVASFEGNEYTAFGTAIHLMCEKKIIDNDTTGLKIFEEAFEYVDKNYVDDIDEAELIISAIKGMLKPLDPYAANSGCELVTAQTYLGEIACVGKAFGSLSLILVGCCRLIRALNRFPLG